jgi:hypothetical protein
MGECLIKRIYGLKVRGRVIGTLYMQDEKADFETGRVVI